MGLSHYLERSRAWVVPPAVEHLDAVLKDLFIGHYLLDLEYFAKFPTYLVPGHSFIFDLACLRQFLELRGDAFVVIGLEDDDRLLE